MNGGFLTKVLGYYRVSVNDLKIIITMENRFYCMKIIY